MTRQHNERKRLHYDLTNVGLRAQATAAGLVQMCMELRNAKVLPEAAIERIKDAIFEEISVSVPRQVATVPYLHEVRSRLDRIFAGQLELGNAAGLSSGGFDDGPDRP